MVDKEGCITLLQTHIKKKSTKQGATREKEEILWRHNLKVDLRDLMFRVPSRLVLRPLELNLKEQRETLHETQEYKQ